MFKRFRPALRGLHRNRELFLHAPLPDALTKHFRPKRNIEILFRRINRLPTYDSADSHNWISNIKY
jgi:hypothetical protein